jgi:hypothetical protein
MPIGCMNMSVYMYVGMVIILCMYGPIWVYVYHLTQRSDSVIGDGGARNGFMYVMRPAGDGATMYNKAKS